MPILSPSQIHAVLRQELPSAGGDGAKIGLPKLLAAANLTPEEILENLSGLMRGAEADSTRLRAAETALRLNGLLDKEQNGNNFSVTINILDSEFEVNPILIPRAQLAPPASGG